MEKIKLNNQVVFMRKYVKQAKVHIINKLVKEVKLLQNRKGNEIQVQKAKRKADRFLEAIVLIKKIKPDDVSKLVLAKSKNWKDVLLQKNSSLNDRCIAMLASYEAVEKEVEQFYRCNQQLALKISDLIKQWEDKNKYLQKSPNVKKDFNKREKDNKNVQKANVGKNINCLTKKSKLDIETKSQPVSEKENSSITDLGEMKNGVSYKTTSKENEIPVKQTNNDGESFEPSNDDEDGAIIQNNVTIKESVAELDNADEEIENSANTDLSDNDSENESDSDESDINNHLEEKMQGKKINICTDQRRDTEKNSDYDENAMEIKNTVNSEESDSDDSESEAGVAEAININSKVDTEKQDSNLLEYIKKMVNSEKKFKAIVLCKLDELGGLDEIPITANVNDESSESEEESSEEKMDVPQNKRSDPFFLGCGDDNVTSDGNYEGSSKDEKYASKKAFSSDDGSRRRNNTCFERKENSNDFSNKRKFQTFSHSNKFPKGDSLKFKNESDNFDSFKKDKFRPRDHHDKFQFKDKNNFRNQKGFPARNEHSFRHGKKRLENKSNGLYKRDNKDNYSAIPKGLSKEGKGNDKPLHPSWEAKRKQKKVVNTFQGKRTVFED